MKKLFIILSLGLLALTGCNDKGNPQPPLVTNPTLPPATEDFAPGETITVTGSGFTASDQIWFRTPTKADGDIQAAIVKQTETEITFTVPQGLPEGECTLVLKRGGTEMVLGKVTIGESVPAATTKLYGYGYAQDKGAIGEIDTTTGTLTPIISLTRDQAPESKIVILKNGKIYWNTTEDKHLYCVDPQSKTIQEIGLLPENFYTLCFIDGKLHALLISDTERSYSLVSVDPNTATTTPVADFGSIYQALNIPTSIDAGLDSEYGLVYDPDTKSLITMVYIDRETDCWQLARLDITNQKIVPGETVNFDFPTLFQMGDKVCGAFHNTQETSPNYLGVMDVEFRPINTTTLTSGASVGNVTLENNVIFSEDIVWRYDAETGKAYGVVWKNFDTPNEKSAIAVFDFNTQQFFLLPAYSTDIQLRNVF